MNYIFKLLQIHLLYILVSSIHTNPSEQPLIFNPFTREVFDFQGESSTYKGGPYAVACPAENQSELNFMKNHSVNFKSLFIRHYSDTQDESFGKIKCKTPVELSLAYYIQDKGKLLRYGYEVFHIKSQFFGKQFDRFCFYPMFRRISEKQSLKQRFSQSSFPPNSLYMKSETPDDPDRPMIEMGCQWISQTDLYYNKSTQSVNSTFHETGKRVDKPWGKCKDYVLNGEVFGIWYKKYSKEDFYSEGNQETIFRSLKFPKYTCQSKYNCLKKYSLVPPYKFQPPGAFEQVSCSDLVSIPIWYKAIEHVLDYLETFLVAVAQIADKELRIRAYIYDTLALPISGSRWRRSKEIYLNQNEKKIPVPKFILKFVKYETYDCVTYNDCWFFLIIVIHNQPEVSQRDKLCTEDKCQQLGWGSIRYQNTANEGKPSEHIYCCELNKKLKKILNMSKRAKIGEYLDLNNFPYYNTKTKKQEYKKYKLQLIETKVNQLIELGTSPDQNSQMAEKLN